LTQRKFIDEWKRTHYCGDLRGTDVGKQVVLFGWVDGRRDLGGCLFVDLRDREGVTQVVFDPSTESANAEVDTAEMVREGYAIAEQLRSEWVIAVRGLVISRGENANRKIPTGEVEVRVQQVEVFNRAETPPFEIVDKLETREDLRLQYRFLDLRRHRMQKTFRLRHRMNQCARGYLSNAGCLELETPVMVKYTPGGARNFLVPSRHAAGKFYALAESPQLFKQLFMVAGFDRYFQIVKCFRDEDFRLDRQPEFTQVDIEMSFVNQDDIFSLVEGLMFRVVKETCGIDLLEKYAEGRFPRMAFADSMSRFGNDKPDLRFGLEHVDLTDLVIEHGGGGVPFFEDIAKRFADGTLRRDVPTELVKGMRVPASAQLSRSDTEKLEGIARSMGAKGLARAKVAPDGTWAQSPMAKSITLEMRVAINEAMGAEAGDVLLFQFGKEALANTVLANLRIHLAKKLGLIPPVGHGGRLEFLWVIDPPMFEHDEDRGGWVAAHHAFTRPLDEHVPLLATDPAKVQCYRYDLVLNGFEIGGGSIRLHDPAVQQAVFRTLGIGETEAEEKFGFLLKALRHGAPPHGGIALGWDRIAMLLSEAESLRDVIPFPKTQRGTDPMTEAPSVVAADQLAEVHIRVLDDERS
jgi:aspartyl-tRNA synthetase